MTEINLSHFYVHKERVEMISGIIPLNKPVGMTSFDCVSRIRHLYNQKRVGHSGTLDPNVNGVLPICLGYATKLVDNLMATGKIYQGAITLGFATTTEDLDGTIIATDFDFKPLTDQQINNGLQHFFWGIRSKSHQCIRQSKLRDVVFMTMLVMGKQLSVRDDRLRSPIFNSDALVGSILFQKLKLFISRYIAVKEPMYEH